MTLIVLSFFKRRKCRVSSCLAVQVVHRYFRCMAYDKSESRLVIVGEDGRAGKANTSQQLAAALSVSVWDISNAQQPLLVCTTGSKQVHQLLLS